MKSISCMLIGRGPRICLFKLSMNNKKSCECGFVNGKYTDNVNSVTNGNGISIAIGNGSLLQAIQKMKNINKNQDRRFFIDNCRIEFAWIRPNDGEGNPHSSIQEE